MRRLALSFVVLLPLAACSAEPEVATSDEPLNYDLHAPGTVPSRFANPNRAYLPIREIASLKSLGALSATMQSVLGRVDGILVNKPADGWVTIEELVRAEQPDAWPGFFDEEQAAFPAIWDLMEAPDAVGTEMAELPSATPINRTIPSGQPVHPVKTIAELPAEWQTTMMRLERLHNGDGDVNTVAYADVTAALAAPAPFTAAEVEHLKALEKLLRETATVTPGHAVIEVPNPGAADVPLYSDLGVSLVSHRTIKLTGVRHAHSYPSSSSIPWETPITTALSLSAVDDLEVLPPEGKKVIFIRPTGKAFQYSRPSRLPEGTSLCRDTLLIVEIWSEGVRTDARRVPCKASQSGTKKADLSRYFDYEIIAPDGTPLVANPTATSSVTTGMLGRKMEFVYERTEATYPGVNASIVTSLATPKFALPPARYRISYDGEPFVVEVFASGAVLADYRGETFRLDLAWDRDGSAIFWGRISGSSSTSVPRVDRPYLLPNGKVWLPSVRDLALTLGHRI